MSLRLRLTLWYTGILAAVLLLVCVIVYFTLSFSLNQQTSQFLNARARQYAQALLLTANSSRGDRGAFIRESLASFNPDTYAQFVAPDGTPLAYSTNLPAGWPLDKNTVNNAMSSGRVIDQTVTLGDSVVRIENLPLHTSDGQALGVLQLGRDITQQQGSLAGLREVLALACLGGIVISFGAGWLLARQTLRPIGRVAQTAEDIGDSGDFARRVQYDGPNDELGRLCSAFNRMLGHIQAAYQQIENALQSQRRFVADASHELRTPLTTIRGNIGLLASKPDVSSQDRQEAMEDIASETERMSRLVSNLLVLARADAGLHVAKQPVQLDEVIHDVYRQARVLSDGVALSVEGPEPAQVEGSPDHLKQLLLILVDNALKNTPPGGQVTIADPIQDGFVRLTVKDTGKGIPAGELPHIFERFYQADRSRSGGGTGLGLAIAKWIAEEHGGHIEAESNLGQGSTFTVWLPRNGHDRSRAGSMEPVSSGAALG